MLTSSRVALCLVGVLCGLSWAPVQGRQTGQPEDVHNRIRRLTLAMYPGLSGRGLMSTVNPMRSQPLDSSISSLSDVVFTIKTSGDSPAPFETVLRVLVAFREDSTLYSYIPSPESPFMRHDRIEALGKLAFQYRDRSDADLQQAVIAAGTAYGPDKRDAVERELRVRAIQIGRVLGETSYDNLWFSLRDVEPTWTVDLSVKTPQGRKIYRAALDPFDGKLLGMSNAGR